MTKPLLFSFEAIADPDAELLILYANRRNAFWKIMAQWLGFDPNASYEARLCELKTARIALWDVLQSCTRVGSLDAKIDADSITVNDFPAFFAKHDRIRAVFFNGAKAESAYRHHVLPTVGTVPLSYLRLPSTSPAHAALSYRFS